MLPDRVSNPGPLTYESGALPIALRGPAGWMERQSYLLHGEPELFENYCHLQYIRPQNLGPKVLKILSNRFFGV